LRKRVVKRRFASTISIRKLMLVVAVVAASMSWSAHWSDCKRQAVLHAGLAAAERPVFFVQDP
jgi:hypothetical protein